MMCDSRMWRAQISALLPHCQVQVGRIDTAESVALIAAQLLASAAARFALAGLSMATAIPNAWLQVVADCGHLSTMEQPDAVSAAMQAWLQAA
jgi:pimeloyl-ACP methyl ester carboxylesterase